MGSVHAKEKNVFDAVKSLSSDKKARVQKVHIDGIVRTKDDALKSSVLSLFQVHTLADLFPKIGEAKSCLESLGAFKEISISVDSSPDEPENLEVTFHVLESKRVKGGIDSSIGNNSGSLSVNACLPNTLGRGERVQVEYSRGTDQTTNCNLSLHKPFIGPEQSSILGVVYQNGADLPWSLIRQLDRGMFVELASSPWPINIRHRLRCESVWRHLSSTSSRTAFDVRSHAGHSLKCSLKHSATLDSRDNVIVPTMGVYAKFNSELAMKPGNIVFNKHELELQLNKSFLSSQLVIQGSLLAGIMSYTSPQCGIIADHFFLGGPYSIRGFAMNGFAPNQQGCALGANSYWATALHMFLPLPFRPGRGSIGDLFRTHLFLNAGNLENNLFGDLDTLCKNVRVSYGAGLILKIGSAARFELNYCIPVRAASSDLLHSGLQFGIGVSFL